jgi:hypothetical protein
MQFYNKTDNDLVLTVFDVNRFDNAGNLFTVLPPTLFTTGQPITVLPFTAGGDNKFWARWAAQTREVQPRQAGGDAVFDMSQITQEVDVSNSDLNANDERPLGKSLTGKMNQKPSGTGRIDVPPAISSPSRNSMFPSGVSVSLSGWTTYQMNYLNGARTYNEVFALVRLEQAYVAAAGGAIGAAVNTVAAWLTAVVPVFGPAIAGLLELAAGYYSVASLNPDGSVTVMLADHYCGTKAGGLDVTATPYPGMRTDTWEGVVRGVQALAT